MSDYIPLSVRHGDWRTKLRWKVLGAREALALTLAPWMRTAGRQRIHEAEEAIDVALAELTGLDAASLDGHERECLNAAVRLLAAVAAEQGGGPTGAPGTTDARTVAAAGRHTPEERTP